MKNRKSETRNIAGRDIGEETLQCVKCGRFWGKDQLLETSAYEGQAGAVGQCPGVTVPCGGLVYPKSEMPKKEKK